MPNTLQYENALKFYHLTGSGSGTIVDRPGALHRVVMNTAIGLGTALAIYDSDVPFAGSIISSTEFSNQMRTFKLDGVSFNTGLSFSSTSTLLDVTIIYE
jgi:hypothetical protein